MSGSDGSRIGGGFEPVNSCDSLVIETQLSSPKGDVIKKIKVGDILDVTTKKSGGVTVVVVIYQNEIAGGIAAPQLAKLRECIEQGTEYGAKVVAINGGQVRVRIAPK